MGGSQSSNEGTAYKKNFNRPQTRTTSASSTNVNYVLRYPNENAATTSYVQSQSSQIPRHDNRYNYIYPDLNIKSEISHNRNAAPQTAQPSFVPVDQNTKINQAAPSAPPATNLNQVNQQTRVNQPAPSAPPASTSHYVSPSPVNQGTKYDSRNRNQSNLPFVKCSTCKKDYNGKIFLCTRGHSSCGNCKSNGRSCGLCGQMLTETRNINVENIVGQAQIEQKCPNTIDGCRLSFNKTLMEKHIQECPFKELPCPIVDGSCNWRGKMQHLQSHFKSEHPTSGADVETEMSLTNICSESNDVKLVTIGTFNFLFRIKASQVDRKIYMAVQLIGTTKSANKWTYEVHVFNKREPRRKYQFLDKCASFNESFNDLIKGQCAILPLQYAMTFVNDGNLMYKIYIKKEFDNRRGRNAKNNNK